MDKSVALAGDGDVAIITIDNPPVNALGPRLLRVLAATVGVAQADGSTRAVVLRGGGLTFSAGADIKEFGRMTPREKASGEGLHYVFDQIESCPKPLICAIHGVAMGGGLEVALACHYRVAVVSARVGQPEVKLGLIPGAGGTQRLPRLVGLPVAARMCALGDPIGAEEAHRLGLIDRIVDGDLFAGALAFARELLARGAPPRRTSELRDRLGGGVSDAFALAELRARVRSHSRGAAAPEHALDAVEAAGTLPFHDGCRKEAELFNECLLSDQSRALVHVFLAERAVATAPGIVADTARLPVRRAAVVGAGTMGGGIAAAYVSAGIPVLLKEGRRDRLDKGLAMIRANFETAAGREGPATSSVEEQMASITPTLDYGGFEDADVVVEAVFEEMSLKEQVFGELSRVTRPDAILASNTSMLDIDRIAAATRRPHMVVGHHFFCPAHATPLLEIVRGTYTSPEVIATSLALAKRLAKVGVVVGNCRGFVGNRMFEPYFREAQLLVEEGAAVTEVDGALCDFGMALGPLAVADLIGLDVGRRAQRQTQGPAVPRPTRVADRLCQLGRFGRKTGRGWYRYAPGSRRPLPDPEVESLIAECRRESGIAKRPINAREIVERTIYALVNEGARVLEEGHAMRAGDINVIYVNGYGFPRHRGGPLWYADTVGLKPVCDRVADLARRYGPRWAPAPLLLRLAERGSRFAERDTERLG